MKRVVYPLTGCALLLLALTISGPSELLVWFRRFDPVWFGLAVLVTIPQFALSAWRWKVISDRLGIRLAYRQALSEYYAGGFLNLVAPGGIGGDAFRIWRQGRGLGVGVNRQPRQYTRAAVAVVTERAVGQVVLGLVVVTAWFGWQGALGACGSIILAVWALIRIGPRVGPIGGLLGRVGELFSNRATAGMLLGVSFAIFGTYVLAYTFAAKSLGVVVGADVVWGYVPLVLAAMTLPVALGGFGPREMAAASAWSAAGLSPGQGVAIALAYGAINVVAAAPGAWAVLRGYRSGVE